MFVTHAMEKDNYKEVLLRKEKKWAKIINRHLQKNKCWCLINGRKVACCSCNFESAFKVFQLECNL